eukprot:130814-Rhodomonas_salina.2
MPLPEGRQGDQCHDRRGAARAGSEPCTPEPKTRNHAFKKPFVLSATCVPELRFLVFDFAAHSIPDLPNIAYLFPKFFLPALQCTVLTSRAMPTSEFSFRRKSCRASSPPTSQVTASRNPFSSVARDASTTRGTEKASFGTRVSGGSALRRAAAASARRGRGAAVRVQSEAVSLDARKQESAESARLGKKTRQKNQWSGEPECTT